MWGDILSRVQTPSPHGGLGGYLVPANVLLYVTQRTEFMTRNLFTMLCTYDSLISLTDFSAEHCHFAKWSSAICISGAPRPELITPPNGVYCRFLRETHKVAPNHFLGAQRCCELFSAWLQL